MRASQLPASRLPASRPAPVATLPPRDGFPALTFSVARTLTFSKAGTLTFLTAVDTLLTKGLRPVWPSGDILCQVITVLQPAAIVFPVSVQWRCGK